MAAIICCRSSPCSAAGSTTRAAATGSTEPEGLRKLSGVANHYGDVTKMVDFVDLNKIANHFREVTKTSLCGVHRGDVTEMFVCSACHDKLLSCELVG
nr:MAG TPA: Cytochrome C' [Caudoviricetes sp.]